MYKARKKVDKIVFKLVKAVIMRNNKKKKKREIQSKIQARKIINWKKNYRK
jgi:hypothetical protein